jgi:hypothetical protein
MGQRYHLDDTTKYVRDGHSKAIISTDVAGLSAYKARKNKVREQTNQLRQFENDINSVKQEMLDIKLLLQQILQNQGR